ncbi:MAG: hypothetical protein KAU48_14750, partial [Candidatus Thorarchaeota archaeon]|nr:hypothetical protein [Candidatus Thorarchaeota archaeon]
NIRNLDSNHTDLWQVPSSETNDVFAFLTYISEFSCLRKTELDLLDIISRKETITFRAFSNISHNVYLLLGSVWNHISLVFEIAGCLL